MRIRPVELHLSPVDALSRWPANLPVVALISQAAEQPVPAPVPVPNDAETRAASARWSRWSILAPINPAAVRTLDATSLAATAPASARKQIVEDAIRSAFDPTDLATSPAHLPTGTPLPPAPPYRFIGLAYELGRVLEPSADPHLHTRATHTPPAGPVRATAQLPLIFRVDCHEALAHDRLTDRWWRIDQHIGDDGAGNLDTILDSLHDQPPRDRAPFSLTPPRSSMGETRYTRAVEQALELIRAGDVFQVNLSHELRATLHGSPRAFFLDLCRAAHPWFGAYIELPRPWSTIASISPELFLSFDARTRRVVTRPIKGTRPKPEAFVPPTSLTDELRHSAKDSAELNMIVDLLRNDLGRVCEFGSLRVDEARGIESHAVLHAVATVSGRLHPDRTHADLILATFPGGSITGAPKVRAMQIIETLEPVPRGVYCGAICLLTADGSLTSSIAIRTATITPDPRAAHQHSITFPVGAGIVADSVPIEEWRETLTKASAFLRLACPGAHAGEPKLDHASEPPLDSSIPPAAAAPPPAVTR